MLNSIVYRWLNSSLDYGITEHDFWDMTIAELMRAIDSRKRMMKAEAQQKAYFDYTLAELIGQSMARIYSSSAKMPLINKAYPNLFDDELMEEQRKIKQAELSMMRFKQFANHHNSKGGYKANE